MWDGSPGRTKVKQGMTLRTRQRGLERGDFQHRSQRYKCVSYFVFVCFFKHSAARNHVKFTDLRIQIKFLCSRSTQINVYFTCESRKIGGLDAKVDNK